MQFQADVLGVPVVLQEDRETTALGAAYLRRSGSGVDAGSGRIPLARAASAFEPAMGEEEPAGADRGLAPRGSIGARGWGARIRLALRGPDAQKTGGDRMTRNQAVRSVVDGSLRRGAGGRGEREVRALLRVSHGRARRC